MQPNTPSTAVSAAIEQRTDGLVPAVGRLADEQWAVYQKIMVEARRRDIPFAVGGGLASMTYAGRWRNTKDLDLYILPEDRERMIEAVCATGLEDYYAKLPYDRNWIFRGYQGETIVDLIWAMANQRAVVDRTWLGGPMVELGAQHFHLIPAEEALWSKLYVLQHDRTDWPDALNLLHGVGPDLDWKRLLKRVAPDQALLAGLLLVFAWIDPGSARRLPAWLWNELGITSPQTGDDAETVPNRARLLDSRSWFPPLLIDTKDTKSAEDPC